MGRVRVTDATRYRNYTSAVPAVLAQFGGKFIVRGGECVSLEGPAETARIGVIEFPTLDAAKAFYNSDAYQKVKSLREGAAEAQFFVIEGTQG